MFTICLFVFWLHTVVLFAGTLYMPHLNSNLPFSWNKLVADIIILWLFKLGITMLIHNKDDIKFVTEFPCFSGHPVWRSYRNCAVRFLTFRFPCRLQNWLISVLNRLVNSQNTEFDAETKIQALYHIFRVLGRLIKSDPLWRQDKLKRICFTILKI